MENKQYKYKVIQVYQDTHVYSDELDTYGRDGFKIVAVLPSLTSESGLPFQQIIFMKEILS